MNVGAIVGVYVSSLVGGFIGENVGLFGDIFVGADIVGVNVISDVVACVVDDLHMIVVDIILNPILDNN